MSLVKALDISPNEKIGICVHDAGAGNQIYDQLFAVRAQCFVLASGPSLEIFKDWHLIKRNRIDSLLEASNLIVTGTSWTTDIECRVRRAARQRNIFNATVVDHWNTNLLDRFSISGILTLPDVIVTTDAIALKAAVQQLPKTKVVQVENCWLDRTCAEVKACRSQREDSISIPGKRILYFSEPFLETTRWSKDILPEQECVDFWFKSLEALVSLGILAPIEKCSLVVRKHPSEGLSAFNKCFRNIKGFERIKFDTNVCSLASQIAWSDIAFGAQTQALVVSARCGIPTYSSLPLCAPKSLLPYKDIQELRELLLDDGKKV